MISEMENHDVVLSMLKKVDREKVVDDILDAITLSVDQFTGQVEQNDDFTLFLVKRM